MKAEDMRRRIEKEIGKVYCWDKATHEYPVLVEKKFGFTKRFTSITAAYKYYFN